MNATRLTVCGLTIWMWVGMSSVSAEEVAKASEAPSEQAVQETEAQGQSTETNPPAAPVAQDTRSGAGLKERTLSEVFEQFVPSETISADNAVPFPIDI